eukprot:SAG11_NODE_1823_length_4206_cov_11.545654_7_plen_183_part_01
MRLRPTAHRRAASAQRSARRLLRWGWWWARWQSHTNCSSTPLALRRTSPHFVTLSILVSERSLTKIDTGLGGSRTPTAARPPSHFAALRAAPARRGAAGRPPGWRIGMERHAVATPLQREADTLVSAAVGRAAAAFVAGCSDGGAQLAAVQVGHPPPPPPPPNPGAGGGGPPPPQNRAPRGGG